MSDNTQADWRAVWIGRMADAEIARLSLTNAERAAVEWFSHFDRPQNGPVIGRHAAALRSLLSRTGSVGDKTGRLASEDSQNKETNPERERLRQVLSQENDGTETCEK